MPVRFAIKNGNWSDPTLWDNGALPLADDDVYANGFTVTIDQAVNVSSIRNTASPVNVPSIATPAMTGVNTPSGSSSASLNASTSWQAFNQDSFTSSWTSPLNTNAANISYTFPSSKVIKRYTLKGGTSNIGPNTWTFQGSNDGITWDILDSVTANLGSSGAYTSSLLSNTNSYTRYRINVTAAQNSTSGISISEIEMTESTGTVLGGTSGGSFLIPTSYNVTTSAGFTASGTLINFTGSTPITLTGNLLFSGGGSTSYCVIHNGTGAMTINGSISPSSNSSSYGVSVNNTGNLTINGNISDITPTTSATIIALQIGTNTTVNINGNVTNAGNAQSTVSFTVFINSVCTVNISGVVRGSSNSSGTSNGGANAIRIASNATVTIVGAIYAGSAGNNVNLNSTISIASPSTINITGDVYGNNSTSSAAIYSTAGGTVNITGNITGGSSANQFTSTPNIIITGSVTGGVASSILTSAAANLTINGVVASSTTQPAVFSSSASATNIFTGPFINNNGTMAVQAVKMYVTATPTNWKFTTAGGFNNSIYTADSAPDYPLISNVRKDISYNAGAMIGTMNIPPAASVSLGVPVDGTVGTAALTVTDIQNAVFDKAVSTLNTSGSIGVRIKNAATADVIGNILTSI